MVGEATEAARQRLSEMFEACADRVYAYVSHRTDPHTAEDVVAETFAIAWRRLDRVPSHALPWLLVTARKVLANELRGRAAVGELLREARPPGRRWASSARGRAVLTLASSNNRNSRATGSAAFTLHPSRSSARS
jgi:DNA-directed RNA polymerase specialized sigma24 family protein